MMCCNQCCGTGTVGTATFALAEPETSCIPVPEPDLYPDGPGFNIECEVLQLPSNKKLEANFLGHIGVSSIEKARIGTNFSLLKNIRNRNENFS